MSAQEVQARGPEVILIGCSGALEKAWPQFPWVYRWAPTLSTRAVVPGTQRACRSIAGNRNPEVNGGQTGTQQEKLDESELPKAQAGMATNPNSVWSRTWGVSGSLDTVGIKVWKLAKKFHPADLTDRGPWEDELKL